MTKLAWGKAGERFFESGVDRGVLYLPGVAGVPWNGIKAINETPTGGEPAPYYIDGYKYLNVAQAEEFSATLSAFSSPPEFSICNGEAYLQNGLTATQQPRKPFAMSYRTRVGNDTNGVDHGYKIHLVYNALASPASKENPSIGSSIMPTSLSWNVSTMPPRMSGIKPTAHMIIDSTRTPSGLLRMIEDTLYGTDISDARLPTQDELRTWFASKGVLLATNLATNPSFETPGATVVLARNLATNPSFETATTGSTVYRRNLTRCGNAESNNTNGWMNRGGGVVSVSTAVSHSGTSSYAVTCPGVANAEGVSQAIDATYCPEPSGTTDRETVSAWLLAPAGATLLASVEEYTPGGPFVASRGSANIVASGQWERVSITTNSFKSAGSNMLRIIFQTSGTQAITFYIDDVLSEASTTVGDYFDGSMGTQLGVLYQWAGAANASASTAKAAQVEVRRNLFIDPLCTTTGNFGAFSVTAQGIVAVTGNPAGATSAWGWTVDAVSDRAYAIGTGAGNLPPAGTHQGSVWVIAPAGSRYRVSFLNSAGAALVGGSVQADVDGTGGWQLVTGFNGTFDGTEGYRFEIRHMSGTVGNYRATLWTVGSPEPFSGSTSSAGDFTYAWTGTANNSASVQRGVEVYGTSGSGSDMAIIQSAEWSASGGKSVRVIPKSTSNSTFAGTNPPIMFAGGMTTALNVPGKCFTLIAKARMTAPQTGTLSTYARRAHLFFNGSSYTVLSDQFPNEAGEHEIRVTWKVPTGTTSLGVLRLWNGASAGNGDVWWDALTVVEVPSLSAPYTGPAFDGSTPAETDFTYVWTADPDASASTKTAVGVATALSGSGREIVQSSEWAVAGSKSLRVVPTGNSDTDAAAGAAIYSFGPSTYGKCFTVGAVMRLTEPGGTGAVSSDRKSRAIYILSEVVNGAFAEGANVEGEQELRFTFKMPNADRSIRLGGNGGANDAWWDALTVVEVPSLSEPYTGPLFDGSSQIPGDTLEWEGTPHASRSRRYSWWF